MTFLSQLFLNRCKNNALAFVKLGINGFIGTWFQLSPTSDSEDSLQTLFNFIKVDFCYKEWQLLK